jgi:aldose 1-epimerase
MISTGFKSGHEQISKNRGYDHVFRLNQNNADHVCATLTCEDTGIKMDVMTTSEAIVLYTSNFMDDSLILCDGVRSSQHLGVCLETQYFPNDINSDFIITKTVLRPGEEYEEKTVYAFKQV